MRSPVSAVQFAAWTGMFQTIECCMVAVRKKEDPLNTIVSAALAAGLVAVRYGPKVMAGSAALGGLIYSMIEAANLMSTRWMSTTLDTVAQQPELEDPRNLPSKSSWMEDLGHNKVFADRGLRGFRTADTTRTLHRAVYQLV
uniref:ATP synthase subunit n=1 Tax=Steinernema glaseri TaxID=37863 RepID=A0A1I7YUH8_9BILA